MAENQDTKLSTHKINIFPVTKTRHPNADSLSIFKVPGTEYTICLRTDDWKDGDLAAYIEPDYVVPADRPEFNFLEKSHKVIENNGIKGYRIKVKKLRGVMSMGMLVPAPSGLNPGDDAMQALGIVRYEPPEPMSTGGESIGGPPLITYKYDIENAYKYSHLFQDGELVSVSEKVDGSNGRFVYSIEKGMFCGSRTEWKKQDEGNLWWKALVNHPELLEFCTANPGIVVYGEVYGAGGGRLKYGVKNGPKFIVFDLLRDGSYVGLEEAREMTKPFNLTWVPELYRGVWNKELIFSMSEGESEVAKSNGGQTYREGVVVRPLKERFTVDIGRLQIKIVSNTYLEKA